MLALAAGRDLLAGLTGTLFHESAISALEKVKAALPEPLLRRASGAPSRVSAAPGATHDYRRAGAIVQALVDAIDHQCTVRLEYRRPLRSDRLQ